MFDPNLQSFVLIDIMPLGFLGCSSKAQIILNRLTDVIFVGFAVKLFWIENE